MEFKKGQRIKITNDSILTNCMGLGNVVHGTVFTLDAQGHVVGFQCDKTGCIEGVDDGIVEPLGLAGYGTYF